MRIYQTHKKVFSLSQRPQSFLNGLISNDLQSLNNAFLNIHGRIVVTFNASDVDKEEMFICIEENYINKFLGHIDKYVHLSGVVIKLLEHNVYFDLDERYSSKRKDVVFSQKAGRLIATTQQLETNVTEEQFNFFRISNGIPIQGIDYSEEMVLNINMEDYVSFTKGCFLGQEPVSKVYHRSKPTWNLVVQYVDECTKDEVDKMTSCTFDESSGREMGFVFVKND